MRSAKANRGVKLVLVTLAMVAVMAIVNHDSAAQIPGQPTTAATTKPTLKVKLTLTKLEVKEFSGEFENWTNKLTINSPEKVAFRWSTKEEMATSAKWKALGTLRLHAPFHGSMGEFLGVRRSGSQSRPGAAVGE